MAQTVERRSAMLGQYPMMGHPGEARLATSSEPRAQTDRQRRMRYKEEAVPWIEAQQERSILRNISRMKERDASWFA
jgi:hypothetical protein